MKRALLPLVLLVSLLGYSRTAFALGECGLSCCIAGAVTSGVTLATKFGLAFQYEFTFMETLKKGEGSISPGAVLDTKAATWPMMPMKPMRFSVPTEMTMHKFSLLATYPATERLQFLAILPYVRNTMTMRVLKRDAMGMDMRMDHEMPVVEHFPPGGHFPGREQPVLQQLQAR